MESSFTGVTFFINPKYRGLRLGPPFMTLRKKNCVVNLKSIIFLREEFQITVEFKVKSLLKKFVEKVKKKSIAVPVLSFQLNNDFHD
jgi:hypothetical protein